MDLSVNVEDLKSDFSEFNSDAIKLISNSNVSLPSNRSDYSSENSSPNGSNEIQMIDFSDTPKKDGASIVWHNLSVFTSSDGKVRSDNFKQIINNVTGLVEPGTLTAVMGSSGAGKSTLMSSLAYRPMPGTITQGTILINSQEIGPYMDSYSGFVHQDDLFYGSLTVFEHLYFMAHFKLDKRMTLLEKKIFVQNLIEKVGLDKCSESLIGDADDIGKILSGGELKRLSVATELMNEPAILFCDEPTSGLDSFNARQIIKLLRGLTMRGTTVMCTIHQPSSSLFRLFDSVLLLAEGRIAFLGTPTASIEFFSSIGHVCPPNYNPADFLISILAIYPDDEASSQRNIQKICDYYAVSDSYREVETLVGAKMNLIKPYYPMRFSKNVQRQNWFIVFFWLLYRNFIKLYRRPTDLKYRLIQKSAIALTAGICFLGATDLTQPGLQTIQGVLFILMAENTFSPMYMMLNIFPQDFPLMNRERKSGLYDMGQYYYSHALALIPALILDPIVFATVLYFLAGLKPTASAFFLSCLITILVMNVSCACGRFFSAIFKSVPMAMAYLVPFDYILMITSGFFVQLNSLSAFLSWTKYFSWLKYGSEALSIIQWDGIQNITCFEEESLPCLQTGEDVLDHYSFETNNFLWDYIALLLLIIIFDLLGFFTLYRRFR